MCFVFDEKQGVAELAGKYRAENLMLLGRCRPIDSYTTTTNFEYSALHSTLRFCLVSIPRDRYRLSPLGLFL